MVSRYQTWSWSCQQHLLSLDNCCLTTGDQFEDKVRWWSWVSLINSHTQLLPPSRTDLQKFFYKRYFLVNSREWILFPQNHPKISKKSFKFSLNFLILPRNRWKWPYDAHRRLNKNIHPWYVLILTSLRVPEQPRPTHQLGSSAMYTPTTRTTRGARQEYGSTGGHL